MIGIDGVLAAVFVTAILSLVRCRMLLSVTLGIVGYRYVGAGIKNAWVSAEDAVVRTRIVGGSGAQSVLTVCYSLSTFVVVSGY